jgi:hypothetical protein
MRPLRMSCGDRGDREVGLRGSREERGAESFLEGSLAYKDLRRRVLGDLFCRDFEELSLAFRGGREENNEKMSGNGEEMVWCVTGR